MLLHGDKQGAADAAAHEKAPGLEPNDATEALDAACAREQLESAPFTALFRPAAACPARSGPVNYAARHHRRGRLAQR